MRLLISLFIVISLAQPAYAQSWFKRMFGASSEQPSVQEQTRERYKPFFSDDDRRQVEDYFREKVRRGQQADSDDGSDEDARGKKKKKKRKGKKKGKSKQLPPGLAKKDALPPGLAKQLEKNGTLPPGLAKRNLPDDLESRLSKKYKDYERVVVDRDVVLVEKTTGKILDILRDVVIGQ